MTRLRIWRAGAVAGAAMAALGAAFSVQAQDIPPEVAKKMAAMMNAKNGGDNGKKEFPPYEEVIDGYDKVVSTVDGQSLYTLWVKRDEGEMLAELPRNFDRQKLFLGYTIASGIPTAGIQAGDRFVYWKRYDKRLALVEPNLQTRTSGDIESQKSKETLFTDRVLVDIPIVTMSPQGGPVIDMDDLFVNNAGEFFGVGLGAQMREAKPHLRTVAKAKAFPQNITFAFEFPMFNGQLGSLAYSMSVLPERSGYQPREADPRIGFFVTAWNDLAKAADYSGWTRYINRWNLEKADPNLSLSPPKEPIVFYLDHKTPVKYRRWVREGVLEWNKAFEQVGIASAVEVYQQDARTGAHMEKDPEDVRYNFIVWNSNNASFAIGPSRVDPRTGQILDADVVMNDGWLRFAAQQFRMVVPRAAMEGFSPEVIEWLDENPDWDPRLRLASPTERREMLRQRARDQAARLAGHEHTGAENHLLGDHPLDGLSRVSQVNGFCNYAMDRGVDLAMARLALTDLGYPAGQDIVDGVPEDFVGGVVKDVVMHEVGHVLGLRHNFKASAAYTLDEINSEEWKEEGKPITGSVMDYNAMNYTVDDQLHQGAYFMTTLGEYDKWVIEYGYTLEKDLAPILERVNEQELQYLTDENTWGPDPLARRRDMGRDALDFVDSEMELAQELRDNILDRVVEEGESWERVRTAFQMLLGLHVRAVSTAANWVGGVYVHRDRVGDPGDRRPTEVVPAKDQRRALHQVIDYAFQDDAFGLDPEILNHISRDKWWGSGSFASLLSDPQYDVHDTVLGIQASALTMLMNPTTLRRVYDNEFRVPADEDALTVPEVLYGVTDAVWSELDGKASRRFTAREPMISSLRRNLQREHLERLIDLTQPETLSGAAGKAVMTLATHKLREVGEKIDGTLEQADSKLDPYTLAHLSEAKIRIGKALDAQYIYNTDDISAGGGAPTIIFGDERQGR